MQQKYVPPHRVSFSISLYSHRGFRLKPPGTPSRPPQSGSLLLQFLIRRRIFSCRISIHHWRGRIRSRTHWQMTTSKSICTWRDSSKTRLLRPNLRRPSSPWYTHHCWNHHQTRTHCQGSGEKSPWKRHHCHRLTLIKATSNCRLRQIVEWMWIVMSNNRSRGGLEMTRIKAHMITEILVIHLYWLIIYMFL